MHLFIAASLLAASCARDDKPYQITSPDKNIVLEFSLNEGRPLYSVQYRNQQVILPSELGMSLKGDIQLAGGFQIERHGRKSENKTWKPLWGIHDTYSNHYNELSVTLEKTDEPNHKLRLIFRAYDDGVAFRYHIPKQSELSDFTILSEDTRIRFAGDHQCFGHFAGKSGIFQTEHQSVQFSEIDGGSFMSLPFLVEANHCWISIMEADLTDYAGMSLAVDTLDTNTLVCELDTTSKTKGQVMVRGTAPHDSPWRVLMLGDRAGDFIESPLLYNLNEPCKLEDTSWIKPGKVTWPWWNSRTVIENGEMISESMPVRGYEPTGKPTNAVMRHYTDFAARNGIPYLLVDASWYGMAVDVWDDPAAEDPLTMEEELADVYDIQEVIDYANRKGIGVWLWVHLGSILTKEKVDTVLSAIAEWGAVGIKTDYYEGEDQDLVNHFHYLLDVAARHKLMINYHGSYKPTGEMRTFPHYLTSEAIHGLEFSKGNKSPLPEHNVIIPYTRMPSGPMDYTPGAFDLDGTETFPKYVQTTRAQQMAMYVVYFSPMQMLVDYPHAYVSAPEQFEFLRKVPVTWDETKFLKGYPGDYVAVARRKGDDWFVGVMNNGQSDRQVSFALDFLEEGVNYMAHIYKDAPDADENPEHVVFEKTPVTADGQHTVVMASGGGEAIWLEVR